MIKTYQSIVRKKRAVKWDGSSETFGLICSNFNCWASLKFAMGNEKNSILIDTPEGQMRCEEGDYVIEGIKGEIYPCKAEIFESSYEEVTD
jgi:hypothetical protein